MALSLEKASHEEDESSSASLTIEYSPSDNDLAAKSCGHEVLSRRTEEQGDQDVVKYLSGWKMVIVVLSLCLAVFCMALDNTIIAVAIPRITDQFHALNDVGWYASAYLLTTCSLQLLYGRIYTYFSIKWVFFTAVVIFEIGSAVCGAAPSSTVLIGGRAIAGVGAAGIFTGAILIIAHTVPLKNRPTYIGLFGAMYGIASVAGPLLGGLFTDSSLTWRWCFFINLPVGAITLIFLTFFLKIPQATQKVSWKQLWTQIDFIGVMVFLPCIICLLLALKWGGSIYEWNNGRIIALLVIFGLLAIVFAAIQVYQGENATVPVRIVRQRNILGGIIFSFNLGAAFFILIYWIPIWFQAIKGVDATQSGINTLPMILSVVVFSILSGISVTVTGYYTPCIILSSLCMGAGAGGLTTFEVDTPSPTWIGLQILFGVGVGCGIEMTLTTVQTVLPLEDVATGTALIMFAQTLGGAMFSSIAQNVFTTQLLKNLEANLPQFPARIVVQSGATLLRDLVPEKALHLVLDAYNKSLTDMWYTVVATGCFSLIGALMIEWRSTKGKANSPSTAV